MNDRQKLIEIRDSINDYLNGFNLSAIREGNRIRIEWDGEINEIQWLLEGKVVSLNYMWNETPFEPDPITGNSYYIGNEDTVDGITQVTVGISTWDDKKKESVFDKKQTVPVSQPENEPAKFYYGWWDGDKADSWGTVVKRDVDLIKPDDRDIIVFIGGFKHDKPEDWESRLRHKGSMIPDDVRLVILEDEPHQWSVEQLENLVRLAKEVIGDYPFTYSFRRSEIEDDTPMPQNIDYPVLNTYLFYEKDISWQPYITTQEGFNERFDLVMSQSREKFNAKGFWIVGQAFGHRESAPTEKMRVPTAEQIQWYYDYISMQSDIEGILWFEYDGDGNRWYGAKDLPDVMESVKEV